MMPIAEARGRVRGAFALALELPQRYRTIVRYAIVGGTGYVIYLGLVFVLYDLHAVPFFPAKHTSVHLVFFTHTDLLLLIASVIAAQASIFGAFAGHSLWTFADREKATKPLWLRFLQFEARALISTMGVLTVAVNAVVVIFGALHYLAVPAGLVISFAWNWGWDSTLIWRKSRADAMSR